MEENIENTDATVVDPRLDNAKWSSGLVQALPYFRHWVGKVVVVKYGGNAMLNEELKACVMEDIVLLSTIGIKVVLVHGGGPEINHMLERVGKESKFVNGLRYTDEETMEIVTMVLTGKLNKDIVGLLIQKGGKAVGLSGVDSGLIRAKKIDKDGADLGLVGEVTSVNPEIVQKLLCILISGVACEIVADMDFLRGLLRDCLDERTVVVAQTVDRDSRQKVYVFFSIDIRKCGSLSAFKGHVEGTVIVYYYIASHKILQILCAGKIPLVNHCSDTPVAEHFNQKRVGNPSVDYVGTWNSSLSCHHAAFDFGIIPPAIVPSATYLSMSDMRILCISDLGSLTSFRTPGTFVSCTNFSAPRATAIFAAAVSALML